MVILRAMALLALGAAAGAAINATRPDRVSLGAYQAPVSCDQPAGGPVRVEVAAAATLCGASGVLVADARSAQEYAAGHIAGAVHLPCDAAARAATDALARGDLQTVLVYARSTEDALPVAASLYRRIHRPEVRVLVLEGGFAAWEHAGLACASGQCDHCTQPSQGTHP